MSTIAALLTDRGERDRLGLVLGAFGNTRFCDRAVEVRQMIAKGDVVAVVLTRHDADGRSMVPFAADLVRRLPTLPVLVSVPTTAEDAERDRAALALLTGVAVFDPDQRQALLSLALRLIAPARAQNAVGRLLDIIGQLEAGWPPIVRTYVRTVVLHAHWPLTVPMVMELIDPTKRRTLDHQLKLMGLPTAEQLLGWALVAHAMWLWDLPDMTLEASARAVGFNDASALRSLVVNRTGLSPTEVRKRGGFGYLVDRFGAVLRGDWSREAAERV